MQIRASLAIAAALLAPILNAPAQPAQSLVLHVSPAGNDAQAGTVEKPIRTLAAVQKRLNEEPRVMEVVFHSGIYSGGLSVDARKGADRDATPLLLRAAEGEEVILDGAGRFPQTQPLAGAPGVFVGPFEGRIEATRMWETDTRVRYTIAADVAAVRHFPGSFTVRDGKIYLHTSDGKAPGAHQMGISGSEAGISIHRSFVTVRGFTFRNYLVRAQSSTGVDVRQESRQVTVQDCRSINCSVGFIVYGGDHRVLDCQTEDVGNGIYVGGTNVLTEGCRFFKTRDAFIVPVYSQDDTGIQYYGGDGVIRRNLCVGFDKGVFLKSSDGPHLVEHNTLVCTETGVRGDNWGLGNATTTLPDKYRFNIIVGFAEPFLEAKAFKPGTAESNCVWIASSSEEGPPPATEETIPGRPHPRRRPAVRESRCQGLSPRAEQPVPQARRCRWSLRGVSRRRRGRQKPGRIQKENGTGAFALGAAIPNAANRLAEAVIFSATNLLSLARWSRRQFRRCATSPGKRCSTPWIKHGPATPSCSSPAFTPNRLA